MNRKKFNTEIFNPELINFDISKLQKISNYISHLDINKLNLKKKVNLTVSSDYTTDFWCQILKLFLLNKKIQPNIIQTEFGSLRYNVRNLKSPIWKQKTDFFILIPSSENLSFRPDINDKKKIIKKMAEDDAELWLNLWNKIDKKIIQTTFDPPIYPGLSNEDGIRYGGYLHYIRMVNNILVENLPRHVNLIDVENLLLQNTNTNWQDNRMYSLAKQPFSMSTIPPLVKSINNNIIYSLGITKKVIVIDLDNTIWGGIIGDDGIGGIELGDETPEGEAFVRFQKYLKKLSKNGLILCVCSKNDESIAKEVFKKHKSMVLKLDDVSIFVANYNDKATNIKKISKTLNLGLDSFVFIDDSKIECSIVKKVLPDVSVVNVSNDPSEFINIIEKLSLFNFRNVTDEDINRVQSYKKINQLHLKKSSTNNLEKFLQDLKPTISIEKVNPINVIRGSQLIAKTNQFKFNSKTYSEKELLKQKKQVLLINFKDNIQNYGIISSLVFGVDKSSKILEIKNWVISCRVFSRRIENFILIYLINKAKKNNFNKICFSFQITKKNIYLQNFLKELGIKIIKDKEIYSINFSNIKNLKKNYIKLSK